MSTSSNETKFTQEEEEEEEEAEAEEGVAAEPEAAALWSHTRRMPSSWSETSQSPTTSMETTVPDDEEGEGDFHVRVRNDLARRNMTIPASVAAKVTSPCATTWLQVKKVKMAVHAAGL